jgi:DNA-binding PucR family transcriptional regulator
LTARSKAQAQRRPGFTLGDLLASLHVIDVVIAPRSLDVPVGETVIHDPSAPPPIETDAFVLGVGIDASSRDARDLVVRSGKAGASAVALKLGGEAPDALREASEAAAVALLSVPDEMTWSQVHTLARTARAGAADAADAAGAPLGDLFALANAFAAMVGGPVTIEDRHSQVLAYSSHANDIDEPRRQTILGRRVPDEWLARLEEAGVFKRLWAGEVVRYEADEGFGLRPRLALAVRAGEEILGSIWVAQGDRRLDQLAEDALREAARMAALHLIRHRSAEDLDRNMRGDALRSLLDGHGSVDAIAYRLGVSADGTFAVLAFEPDSRDEVPDANTALERERVVDLVSLYGEAFRQRSAAVTIGRTVYVLLPGPEPARPQRLVEVASDVVERARESIGIGLRAGIGSIVAHLREVPRSRQEADQVLRALSEATDTRTNVADFEAARTRVALIDLRDLLSERPQLRSSKLRRLREHDRVHSTCYVETLGTYLDAFGDIPRAAASAGVHANTLRYRLRRLVEVAGINLGDPDERLLLELDLRLGDEL